MNFSRNKKELGVYVATVQHELQNLNSDHCIFPDEVGPPLSHLYAIHD